MIQPATKTSELIEKLRMLSQNPNEFQLKLLEREAESLLPVDAAAAYTCLGIISCIRGDIAGVHSNHQKSLKLLDNVITRSNYGTSLAFLRLLNESIIQFDIAIKQETTPSLLMQALNVAFQAALSRRVIDYYQMLKKIDSELAQKVEVVAMVNNAKNLLNADVNDEESSTIRVLAEQVCNEFETEIQMQDTWIDTWGEDQPCLVHWLLVNSTRVADMNWRLAELLAEKEFPSLIEGRYHVAFHRLVNNG